MKSMINSVAFARVAKSAMCVTMFIAMLLWQTAAMAMTAAKSAQPKKSKSELKTDYVVSALKIDKAKQLKLRPVVLQYFKDVKTAKQPESALKKKYKDAVKKNTLTDAQANELLAARWAEDHKLASINEQYTAKFKQVVTAKQVYRLFKLIKESGKKISSSNNDEEE